MTAEEFLRLVEEYGRECTAGGAGYTQDVADELLDDIRAAVAAHWRAEK